MRDALRSVVIGADHGGYTLKTRTIEHLRGRGYTVNDLGVFSSQSVDYPDISSAVCLEYLRGGYDYGIVMCGTGIGASIAANKVRGIRCALIHDLFTAQMAAAHNHANIIAFGGRVTYQVPVEEMIERFEETPQLGERHSRRVEKIANLETDCVGVPEGSNR